jgi:hypothetical protein
VRLHEPDAYECRSATSVTGTPAWTSPTRPDEEPGLYRRPVATDLPTVVGPLPGATGASTRRDFARWTD